MNDLVLAMILDAAVLALVSTTVYAVHGLMGLFVLFGSLLLSTYLTMRGAAAYARSRQ